MHPAAAVCGCVVVRARETRTPRAWDEEDALGEGKEDDDGERDGGGVMGYRRWVL